MDNQKITGIKTTSIHERLKFARMQSGLTASEVAEKLGKKPSYKVVVSRWENGQKPSIDKLAELAKIYNASLEWLINGEGE